MTTRIDEIVEDEIEKLLKGVVIDHKNLTVINGFLISYVKDLLDQKNGLSFPCVAIQPVDDIPNSTPNNLIHKLGRTIRLIGAVVTKDRSTIMRRLNALIKEIRNTVSFDSVDDCHETKAISFVLGAVVFDVPDASDQYATFEMTITINYIEK